MSHKLLLAFMVGLAFIGVVGAIQTYSGNDTRTYNLDVSLTNQAVLYLQQTYPFINSVNVGIDRTSIQINTNGLDIFQELEFKRQIRAFEDIVKFNNGQLLASGTPLENLNCRKANDGMSVSSTIIFNLQTLQYVETWLPNPLCDNLLNASAGGIVIP